MTISTESIRNDYVGNDTAAVFAFTFKIFSQENLRVIVADTDGSETVLTLGTDYSVSIAETGPGGSVTLTPERTPQSFFSASNGLKANYKLTIKLSLPFLQETSIRNQGEFFPETHENVFDYLTLLSQQIKELNDRTLRLSETLSATAFNPTLPASIGGVPNAALVSNNRGDGFVLGPTADAIAGAESAAERAETAANAASTSAAALTEIPWKSVNLISDNAVVLSSAVRKNELYVLSHASGEKIINLPEISSLDLTTPYRVAFVSKTTATVTIRRAGTDTIDTVTSMLLAAKNQGIVLIPKLVGNNGRWTTLNFCDWNLVGWIVDRYISGNWLNSVQPRIYRTMGNSLSIGVGGQSLKDFGTINEKISDENDQGSLCTFNNVTGLIAVPQNADYSVRMDITISFQELNTSNSINAYAKMLSPTSSNESFYWAKQSGAGSIATLSGSYTMKPHNRLSIHNNAQDAIIIPYATFIMTEIKNKYQLKINTSGTNPIP